MDQGLKERLVGAAVLVAIGVWLIPWVLDGPESPLDSSASSLRLPAAEEPMPMRTQTLRLGDTAAETADESVPPAAAPEVAQPLPSATASESPAASSETAADRAAGTHAATAAEPPAAEAPAPRVAAAPPPPRESAPAAANGDWIVQLGSFGEEANARRLAERSRTVGYAAEVASYRSNGRTLYRVRVGPATTRGQADAKASALRAHGIEAQVVAAR
jgi:DedD protein